MKKILIGILTIAFIIISIPTLFLYGISKTLINPEFIQGEVSDAAYEFIIPIIAKKTFDQDPMIKSHYEEKNIEAAIKNHLNPEKFRNIFIDMNSQFEQFQQNTKTTITINLTALKSEINNAAADLALQIFQNISICKPGQLPEVNTENIPTCLPFDTNYKTISAPLAKQFEQTTNSIIPDNFQMDFTQNSNAIQLIQKINNIKLYFLLTLLIILAIIVLIITKPFSAIMSLLSWLFMLSGFGSFLMTIFIQRLPLLVGSKITGISQYFGNIDQAKVMDFISKILGYLSSEIQRIALIFILIGAIFKILNLYFKRTENNTYREDTEEDY